MANFCGKCGTGIDTDTGLCPNCDAEKLNTLKNTPKFCRYCGSEMDRTTGLCPNCTKQEATAPAIDEVPTIVETVTAVAVEPAVQNNVPLSTYVSAVSEEKPVEQEVQPITQPEKGKIKASTVISTILLSVCFFITAVLSIAIFDIRNSVDDDNAEKLFKNAKVSDLINNSGEETKKNVERFYGYLEDGLDITAAQSDMDRFVNKSSMLDFAADKIADFFDDFFKADAELEITANEFHNLLEENSDLIYDEFGVYPDEYQLSQIVDWMFEKDEVEILDSIDMENDAPSLYHLLHVGLSYPLMAVLIVLSLLFAILMIWNSWSQAACGIGINLIILGTLTGICAMLASWLTPLWKIIWGKSIIGIIVGNIFSINWFLSLIMLVSGIALLVIRKLILVLIYKLQLKKLNRV